MMYKTLIYAVSETESVSWNTFTAARCPLDQTEVRETDVGERTCERGHKWLENKPGPCGLRCPCCKKPCSGRHHNQIHGVDPDNHWGGAKF